MLLNVGFGERLLAHAIIIVKKEVAGVVYILQNHRQ